MKSYPLIGALLCFTFGLSAQSTLQLHFASAESTLSASQEKQLQKLAVSLKTANPQEVMITGHTDPVGSISYNLELSQKRAEAVKSYLLSQGIPFQLLKTDFLGESGADHENKGDWRRVDISWRASSTYKPVETLYSKLSSTQKHYINPDRDTLLRCDGGTIFHIKAGTFRASENGASVLFEVKEVYKKSDMILENLSTMSNGRILETRGMLYTNALRDGDTLQPLKDITIMMPTEEYSEAAGVFDGRRDPHTDVMNWAVNNNSVLRDFAVRDFSHCQEYADILAKYEEEGINPGNGVPDLTCLMDSGLRHLGRCAGLLCGIAEKAKCRVFFCQFERASKGLVRGIGSVFSRKTRVKRREHRANAKSDQALNRRLEKLRDKDRALTVKEVQEVEELLKEKKERGGKVTLTEEEKRFIKLSRLIRTSDSLISSNAFDVKTTNNCAELDKLFETYGVMDVQELTLAINRPLLDEFGVNTMEELLEALPKANFNSLEEAYASKDISYEDFKFYIFNSSTLGWKNLDIFAKIPQSQQVAVRVNLPPSAEVDCKLVFKEREFVIPAEIGDGYFYFDGMPKGEDAWIVAIKYENEIPYLALMPIVVSKKSFTPSFKEKTLEELKTDLEVLDFNN